MIFFTFFPNFLVRETERSPTEPVHESFPVPAFEGLLFYIQRDPNTNTICYELQTDRHGNLARSTPVKPFWIRYAENGAKTELNYIQRTFAYGIKSKRIGENQYELRAVAYPKHRLVLKKDQDNRYRVFTEIHQKESILKRIFIRIDGGTFWSPNVLYIELTGVEVATGKPVVQRIIPL